jgi:hypothetical protein
MRHFTGAVGIALLSLILAHSIATVAADGGWGTQNSGYYHLSMAESLRRDQPPRPACDKIPKSPPAQDIA